MKVMTVYCDHDGAHEQYAYEDDDAADDDDDETHYKGLGRRRGGLRVVLREICCAGAGVLVTTHHSSASPRCLCEHSNDLQTNVDSHVLESMACADVLHDFVGETLSPGIRARWPRRRVCGRPAGGAGGRTRFGLGSRRGV